MAMHTSMQQIMVGVNQPAQVILHEQVPAQGQPGQGQPDPAQPAPQIVQGQAGETQVRRGNIPYDAGEVTGCDHCDHTKHLAVVMIPTSLMEIFLGTVPQVRGSEVTE